MLSILISILIAIALLFILGIPLVVSKIKISRSLRLETIDILQIDLTVKEFFIQLDQDAEKLGFVKQLDFSAKGLPTLNYNW